MEYSARDQVAQGKRAKEEARKIGWLEGPAFIG